MSLYQVCLERKEEKIGSSGTEQRQHIGTMYFPESTTANEVIKTIMKHERTQSGIWLLQQKMADPQQYSDLEEGLYRPVRKGQHQLADDGNLYVAYLYNAPTFFEN